MYINITIKRVQEEEEESQQDEKDPKLHILRGFFFKKAILGFHKIKL
jgi:hypothetical protein